MYQSHTLTVLPVGVVGTQHIGGGGLLRGIFRGIPFFLHMMGNPHKSHDL